MVSTVPSLEGLAQDAGKAYGALGALLPDDHADLQAQIYSDSVLAAEENRDRDLCRRLSMDYDRDWASMSPAARGMLLFADGMNLSNDLITQEGIPIEAVMGPDGARQKYGAISEREYDRLLANLPPFDPRTHIPMWRPPRMMAHPHPTDPDGVVMKLTHPDAQPVLRTEASRKYTEGWRYYPEKETQPPARLQCEILANGQRCEFFVTFRDDLESHMRWWHENEYPILQSERLRRQQQADARRQEAMDAQRANEAAQANTRMETLMRQLVTIQSSGTDVDALAIKVAAILRETSDAPNGSAGQTPPTAAELSAAVIRANEAAKANPQPQPQTQQFKARQAAPTEAKGPATIPGILEDEDDMPAKA